ncbi:MAG: hypothetical protein GY861_14975 [bacterium]|nr:hypothetical protein [bacterium]
MIDEWVKYTKKRVKKGEHLEAVIQDLPNQGLSQEDAERVLTKIIDEKHGDSTASREGSSHNLGYIIVVVLLVSLLALFLFTVFSGDDTEEESPDIEEEEESVEEENEEVEEDDGFWDQYTVPFPDPVQRIYDKKEVVMEFLRDGTYSVTHVAEYKLAAMVGHKQIYHDFREISPMDLVLFWGGLADTKYMDDLTIPHRRRVPQVRIDRESFYNYTYLQEHSSNHHIIPANNYVLQGLKTIENGDIIYMEGYLVDADGGTMGFWKTSTSRTDEKSEIFYVELLRIEDKVYE